MRASPKIELEIRGRLPGVSRDAALKIVRAVVSLAGARSGVRLAVVAVDEKEIRRLNRAYRGKDKVTDVLSFRLADGGLVFGAGDGLEELGDVFVCVPQVRRQAKLAGRAVSAETALMVAHGTLHLLGHDHRTLREETAMFALQQEALMRLGYM